MNGYLKSEPGTSFKRTSGKMPNRFGEGEKIEARVHALQVLSRRAHRQVFAFLLISTVFFGLRNFDLIAPLAENVREILGCPPPPVLTTLALAGFTLSAMILIAARILNGTLPSLKWCHLGYRTVFYFFYLVSNSLHENFMGAFVAGLVLFGLEQLNIWTYSVKNLPRGKELLGKL